jgi:hypothetical protein
VRRAKKKNSYGRGGDDFTFASEAGGVFPGVVNVGKLEVLEASQKANI